MTLKIILILENEFRKKKTRKKWKSKASNYKDGHHTYITIYMCQNQINHKFVKTWFKLHDIASRACFQSICQNWYIVYASTNVS
jgi:hypothetical protein